MIFYELKEVYNDNHELKIGINVKELKILIAIIKFAKQHKDFNEKELQFSPFDINLLLNDIWQLNNDIDKWQSNNKIDKRSK